MPRHIVLIIPVKGDIAALCDDGTVWVLADYNEMHSQRKWVRVRDIPQNDVEE